MPSTDCPLCWRAESTWLRWSARRLGELLNPPSTTARIVSGMAQSFSVMLGGPVTWYDRHRAAYVETGDGAELARMLRHVTLS